jgi:hypothetical protein
VSVVSIVLRRRRSVPVRGRDSTVIASRPTSVNPGCGSTCLEVTRPESEGNDTGVHVERARTTFRRAQQRRVASFSVQNCASCLPLDAQANLLSGSPAAVCPRSYGS